MKDYTNAEEIALLIIAMLFGFVREDLRSDITRSANVNVDVGFMFHKLGKTEVNDYKSWWLILIRVAFNASEHNILWF